MIRNAMRCLRFGCEKFMTNGGCGQAIQEGYERWKKTLDANQISVHEMPDRCAFAIEHLLSEEGEA
jgi:hypothetical protein